MSIASFAHWLEQRDWAMDFAGSSYFYPIVLATHLTCIAVFGGMILVTNLRLLEWVLRGQSVTDVVGRLRPWKWGGLVLMVTCGVLLAGSEAGKYYGNPYFWTKLALLALLIVHALVFRRVYRNTAELDRAAVMPGQAKLAAALSLILWIGVVCAGRMIGYYEGPAPLAVLINPHPSPYLKNTLEDVGTIWEHREGNGLHDIFRYRKAILTDLRRWSPLSIGSAQASPRLEELLAAEPGDNLDSHGPVVTLGLKSSR